MHLSLLFGSSVQLVTRDPGGGTNISMVVTSAGEVSRANTCGLPQTGTCAGDFEDCYAFESLYCPDWEGIALSGNCIIPNANQICCDEIPEPCRLGWEASGAEDVFCSKSVNCLRPSCAQEEYYLSYLYWKRWKGNSNFGSCFFASAQRGACEAENADFGTASVGLSLMGKAKNNKRAGGNHPGFIQELVDRAAAQDQTGERTLNQATDNKDLPTESSIDAYDKALEPMVFADTQALASPRSAPKSSSDAARKLLTARSSLASEDTEVHDGKKDKKDKKDYDDDEDYDEDYDEDKKDKKSKSKERTPEHEVHDGKKDKKDKEDKKDKKDKKSKSKERTPEVQSSEHVRCMLLTDRRQACSRALEWNFPEYCDNCLEQGTDAPKCDHTSIEEIMSDKKLDFFQKTYCKCLL
eukprot:CAMPEP_0204506566 /NCGR_PEP_ID=MMETSP0471-20130131/109316_1 /ASSEMBLY_ACC=CAM_ASM_000602 /TAXON_ID=2969 /ORGANISM="Oxyrrhis marina" /LENGTH=409 /DNA_ID=CAMNT_0051511571 /DNA_START=92 /DNA_END=1325 /DNA_ORIENTATION=-